MHLEIWGMIDKLQSFLYKELTENILPYWIRNMQDIENGGFYGRIDGYDRQYPKADKGIVLNARILWTFSAAYRVLKNPEYLRIADRAYNYISNFFIDKNNGGVYWELDYLGSPVNTRKQTYAQGFAIYGFSEYYRATGNFEALETAKQLFYLLEKYASDVENGGYIEALDEQWRPIEDMRLSPRDANAPKSMNTHLHILEPYTNLLRVWQHPDLIMAQTRLINVFCDHIINPDTGHLNLFFDMSWQSLFEIISYGHDIEASWLLFEAAETLADVNIIESIKSVSLKIAKAANEGLQSDGSMVYEKTPNGHIDKNRHWWVQAETVVGSAYAFMLSSDIKYFENALRCLVYIKTHISDNRNGEWVWSVDEKGVKNKEDDKAGFWKCPYHNSRMCLELMQLNEKLYTLESKLSWEKFYLAELT